MFPTMRNGGKGRGQFGSPRARLGEASATHPNIRSEITCRGMSNLLSLSRRNHLRDPANARVACIQVALRIHDHVVGFDKLALPSAGSVTHRAEHVAVPVQLEDLAVLTGRQP